MSVYTLQSLSSISSEGWYFNNVLHNPSRGLLTNRSRLNIFPPCRCSWAPIRPEFLCCNPRTRPSPCTAVNLEAKLCLSDLGSSTAHTVRFRDVVAHFSQAQPSPSDDNERVKDHRHGPHSPPVSAVSGIYLACAPQVRQAPVLRLQRIVNLGSRCYFCPCSANGSREI